MSCPPGFRLEPADPTRRPAPHPTQLLKSQIYDDPLVFRDVDNHAINEARTNYRNFRDLIWNLIFKRNLQTVEKIRVIFRWMTTKNMYTIMFDSELPGSPEEILSGFKDGKTTYARIFECLCCYASLHCVTLSGWAKGVDYRPGAPITSGPINHSWNAVFVDTDWQLVDSHWATRYLQSERNTPENLVYEYDDFYFLPEPRKLIYSHCPEEAHWQLLSPACSRSLFEDYPLVKSFFFSAGMQFLQQNQGVIYTRNGIVVLTLGLTQPTAFTFKLAYGDSLIEQIQGVALKRYVVQETAGHRVSFYFRAPREGNYYLTIFAQQVSDRLQVENIFKAACEYKVVCDQAAGDIRPYPLCSDSNWGPGAPVSSYGLTPSHRDAILIAPSGSTQVSFTKSRDVRLFAKLCKDGMDDQSLENYVDVREQENQILIAVKLPLPGEYGLEIYANEPAKEGDTFTHMCQYLTAYTDRDPAMVYGQVYDRADFAFTTPAQQQSMNQMGPQYGSAPASGSMLHRPYPDQPVRNGHYGGGPQDPSHSLQQHPYETQPDSYKGGRDPYKGAQDPYKGGQDPYKGGQDPYKGGQDPYKGAQNPYIGGQDPYKGGQDPYIGGQDPYKGGQDPYKGGQDPYGSVRHPSHGSDVPKQYAAPYGGSQPGTLRSQHEDDLPGHSPPPPPPTSSPPFYAAAVAHDHPSDRQVTQESREGWDGNTYRQDKTKHETEIGPDGTFRSHTSQMSSRMESMHLSPNNSASRLPDESGNNGPVEVVYVPGGKSPLGNRRNEAGGGDAHDEARRLAVSGARTPRGFGSGASPDSFPPPPPPLSAPPPMYGGGSEPAQLGSPYGSVSRGRPAAPQGMKGADLVKNASPSPPGRAVEPEHEYQPHPNRLYTTSIMVQPPEHFQAQPVLEQQAPQPAPPAVPPKPFKDTQIFQHVDTHAVEVSKEEHSSFRDLVWHLIYARDISNELEKARAIFLWLCSSDLTKLNFSNVKKGSPEEILMSLQRGQTTYAVVYETLCHYAGLHCKTISGYAKGAEYKPGMQFSGEQGQHSWNAVLVKGAWRLVDCHWAARRLVGKKVSPENVRYELDEYYFMPDPHQLIFTHFPDDANWQLLERPISLHDFENLVPVKSAFFKYGLQILSHRDAVIKTEREITLRIGCPPFKAQSLTFTFTLTTDDGAEEMDGIKLNRYGMQEMVDNVAYFTIRPPRRGSYRLIIYAKDLSLQSKEGVYGGVCEYEITMDHDPQTAQPFPPCVHTSWGPGDSASKYSVVPLQRGAIFSTVNGQAEVKFKLNKELRFTAKLKSTHIDEKLLQGYIMHRVVGDVAVFTVTAPSTGEFGLEIYANDPDTDGNSLFHAYQYLLLCAEVKGTVEPLPVLPPGYLGPQPSFRKLGLNTGTHNDPYVQTESGELQIALQMTSQPLRLTSQLVYVSGGGAEDCSDYILQQGRDPDCFFQLKLPKNGMYKFQIYGLPLEDQSESLPGVYNYLINCLHTYATLSPFPKQYGQWKESCYLHEPRDGLLQENRSSKGSASSYKNLYFLLDVPKASAVAIVIGEDWTQLEKNEHGSWAGEVSMGRHWGVESKAAVCANYGNVKASYSTLLEFTLA